MGTGAIRAALTMAVERTQALRPGTHVLALYGYGFIAEQARIFLPPEAPGHGGGDEAAVVLAEAPGYARPEAFCAPDLVGPQAELSARLRPSAVSPAHPTTN